jgi:site-specific recombinase XerD
MTGADMAKLELAYVHKYRDRHGRVRHYFRRKGSRKTAIPGLPGSPEFMVAYQAALGTEKPSTATVDGSVKALAIRYLKGSAKFKNLSQSSQETYRFALKEFLVQHGHRPAATLPRHKACEIIERIGVDRPSMANLTKSVLVSLFNYAITINWRSDNPFDKVPTYKTGTLHTWTEDEIAAYEAFWPLGTRERLAFSVLLFTAQRVSDAVKLERGKVFTLTQKKTGTELTLPIHSALAKVIMAGPANGKFLLASPKGEQLTPEKLSYLIQRAAKNAGLPKGRCTHGLRKASLRRLAEHGSTTKEIASVSGHRSLKEVERYTAKADQAHLARSAFAKLRLNGEQAGG